MGCGCSSQQGPRGRAYGCDCPYYRCYRALLWEIVRTLEETRRSFKSRQLAALRRKILTYLAEEERLTDPVRLERGGDFKQSLGL